MCADVASEAVGDGGCRVTTRTVWTGREEEEKRAVHDVFVIVVLTSLNHVNNNNNNKKASIKAEAGVNVVYNGADLTDPKQIRSMVKEVADKLGGLQILW